MLVEATFASWIEAEKSIISGDKRILFDTEDYDRLLVFDYIEYNEQYPMMFTLDKVLGGCWVEVRSGSKYLPALYEYHENKGN